MPRRLIFPFLGSPSSSTATNASAEAATGTGAALDPQVSIAPHTDLASATGAALDATVSTSGTTAAAAELATGTGAALDPQVSIAPHAGQASATGAAYDATVSVGTSALAGAATGTGAAQGPQMAVAPHIGAASATGAAYDAAATTGGDTSVSDSDTGSGADTAALAATRAGADVASGADAASTDTPAPAEAAVGVDSASVIRLTQLPQAACGPYDGPVTILYDGLDFTSCVVFEATKFKSAANGQVGSCVIRVKDAGQGFIFTAGHTIELYVAGFREWGGYVAQVKRGYFTLNIDTGAPEETVKYFEISGVDWNVLFQKRVLFDKVDPTVVELTSFPRDTDDDVVLKYYASQHLDLSGDQLDTESLVEHVGTPSTDVHVSGKAGWTWGQFVQHMRFNTGAIDYINPDRKVVHTDVDTPTAPFGISDAPGDGQIGCRELEIDELGTKLRNEAFVWGAGQGNSQVTFAHLTDSASVDEHGVWQVGTFSVSMWRQATVDRVADSLIYGSPQNRRGGKDPALAVKCVIFEPGLRVADKVEFESVVHGYADTLPVRSIEIDFPEKNPRYQVVMSHLIDDPWSTAEFWWPDIDIDIHLDLPDPFCGDNFNRVVSGEWGVASGMSGNAWSETYNQGNGGPTTWAVTGGFGVAAIPRGFDGENAATQSIPAAFSSLPIEVLIRARLLSGDGDGTRLLLVASGGGGIHWTISAALVDGDLQVSVGAFDGIVGVGVDLEPITNFDGQSFYVRIIVTDTSVSGASWPVGLSEPALATDSDGSMNMASAIDSLDNLDLRVFTGSSGGPGPVRPIRYVYVDDIALLEGSHCSAGSFGLGTNFTVAAVRRGWHCENAARVTDWPDPDPTHSYLGIARFQGLTTQVWVDGHRIRYGADYLEHPKNGVIETLAHIDVGGDSVFNPPKPVWVCYNGV